MDAFGKYGFFEEALIPAKRSKDGEYVERGDSVRIFYKKNHPTELQKVIIERCLERN